MTHLRPIPGRVTLDEIHAIIGKLASWMREAAPMEFVYVPDWLPLALGDKRQRRRFRRNAGRISRGILPRAAQGKSPEGEKP